MNQLGKLINRIPGSHLLISSFKIGSASRTHVESLGKHRDVNKHSQSLPGKLDIKRHSPSILYLYHICLKFSQQTRKIDKRTDILNKSVIKAIDCEAIF